MSKSCFVIMPFGKRDTPEREYFTSLYLDVIKPTVEIFGYSVSRADEMKQSGAISQDIILSIASADLVVADLSALNPNVFYELGVRHTLRGRGTVMLFNVLRDETIPFDLSAYRIIEFEGRIEGIGKLRAELSDFVRRFEVEDTIRRDNPVHDWLPSLPENALEASSGSNEAKLRLEIRNLKKKIQRYESIYGALGAQAEPEKEPLAVIEVALAEVTTGHSPFDLLNEANQAMSRRDLKAFLETVRKGFAATVVRLSPQDYLSLASSARRLGIDEVADAIYAQALLQYPDDRSLLKARIDAATHSKIFAQRERARKTLLEELGFSLSKDGIELPPTIDLEDFNRLGLLLDAFHADSLHAQALEITDAIVSEHGSSTIAARNHARALKFNGKNEEALDWYRRAVLCADADEISGQWFGGELHRNKRYVDALESYALACTFDPNDASMFAEVADELSIVMQVNVSSRSYVGQRELPGEINARFLEFLAEAVTAALSCPDLDHTDTRYLQRATTRAGLLEMLTGEVEKWDLAQRAAWATNLYNLLRSELTQPSITETVGASDAQPKRPPERRGRRADSRPIQPVARSEDDSRARPVA